MTDIQSTASQDPGEPAQPQDEVRAAPTFDVLPLSAELREALAEMGYEHPTPVQIAVWEPATRKQDAVVQARTGTGKTASFGMPIVDHLVRRSMPVPQALVLTPTRELALQVARELERLASKKGVQVVAVYGGAPMPRQVSAIADGAQVIVGTPGRVLDHIRRGTLPTRDIRLLVLDESDEMLSMGFERELTAILDELPKERQTLLFSATVPPDIERIALNKLKSPEFITLSGDHIGALEIEHYVYIVPADKRGALMHVLEVEDPESAILFCNTKDETESLAQALCAKGYHADWLNGDLPQSDREKVMAATREGRLRFLVATDVAARGIDISHLTHVINYDFPQDAESYVHRTGRTGRAGRTGTAISLILPQDIGGLYLLRLTYKIRPIEKPVPTPGELKTRVEADLIDALRDAFAPKGQHPDDRALARRLLTHDDCEAMIAGLIREHLGARPAAEQQAGATRRAKVPPRRSARRDERGAGDEGTREPRRTPTRRSSVVPGADAAPTDAAPAEAVTVEAVTTPQAARPLAALPVAAPAVAAPRAAAPAPARDVAEGDDEPRKRARRRRRSTSELGAGANEGPVVGSEQTPGLDRSRAERAGGFRRHADFAGWAPPEEEGDDQPILGDGDDAGPDDDGPDSAEAPTLRRSRRARGRTKRVPEVPTTDRAPEAPAAADVRTNAAPAGAEADDDYSDLYVNVGRRDGVRAVDIQSLLAERCGLAESEVRRIRVRDRHSFVALKKTELERVAEALTGAELHERTITAEPAREKRPEGA